MEHSKIQWTDNTFSPWVGCTKISPGCDNCYAESWAKRSGSVQWGAHPRRRTRPANWNGPVKWNRQAAANSTRIKVFCSSLADVFDNDVPIGWRADLFQLIYDTPHLDWQILTKRIGNAAEMIEQAIRLGGGLMKDPWPWKNVWIGATVVNQEEADRDLPKLMQVPAHIRFLSCEPLLGPVSLAGFITGPSDWEQGYPRSVDWVIVGGESGPRARPMQKDWASQLQFQCRIHNVPFFMKQWSQASSRTFKDFETFPLSLQVREFPNGQSPS